MHKLLVWHDKANKWCGYNYHNKQTIKECIDYFLRKPKEQEIFTSIQNFDEKNVVISCPIYADFDGETALEDARAFAKKCYELLGEYPSIAYSGSKGLHLVMYNHNINHPRCHLIVRNIVKNLGEYKSLDTKVYTNRRLWRSFYSYNFKGERYKIPITYEELLLLNIDEIREMALDNTPREIIAEKNTSFDMQWFYDKFDEAIDSLRVTKEPENQITLPDKNLATTPCILSMFNTNPREGYFNTTIFVLAKYMKCLDITLNDAIDTIMGYDHFKIREESEHDVVKVIKSVYSSGSKSMINCEIDDQYSEVMRSYCSDMCWKKIEVRWI